MKAYSLLLFVLGLARQVSSGTIAASLTLGSDQLSAETTYTFTIKVETTLDTSNHFIIEFSADLGIQIPNTLAACTGVTGFTDSSVPCIKLSETQIRIGCFLCDPGAHPDYEVGIQLTNPVSARDTTYAATVSTYSDSTLLDSSNNLDLLFNVVPLPSSSVSLTSLNPVAGQLAQLRVTIDTVSVLPQDTQIVLKLPKWSQASLGASTETAMVSSSIVSSCSTFSPNSPTCSVSLDSSVGSLDSVTIAGAFASSGEVASGTTFSATITNVLNPPTMQPRSGFELLTLDAQGNTINSCSGLSLTLDSAFSQTSLAGSSVALTGEAAPGREGTYTFNFETTLPIPRGGSLQLTLPPEIALPSAGLASIAISDTSNISSGTSLSQGASAQIILFSNGFSSTYVEEGSSVVFTLSYLRNPLQNSATQSFQIATFDGSGYSIESLAFGLAIEAASGVLSDLVFEPVEAQRSVYQYASDFTLSFTLENNFESDSQLVLNFEAFSTSLTDFALVSDGTCTLTSTTHSVSSSAVCSVFSSQKTVQIDSLFSSRVSGGTDVALQLSGLRVRNPGSTSATASIYVYTVSNGQSLDSATSTAFTPEPATLASASITPSVSTASQQNVEYTIKLQPSGPIPLNAVIRIVLPSEVQINNKNAIESRCRDQLVEGISLKNGRQPSFNCDVTRDGFVEIERLFSYGEVSEYQQVTVTLPGLQNPRTVGQASSSFELYVFEGQNMEFQIYNQTESLTVTMTDANPFSYATVTSDSQVNGAVTTYRVQLEGALDAQSQDTIVISFPRQVTLGDQIVCTGDSFNLSPLLQCDVDYTQNRVTVILALINWRVLFTGIQKMTIGVSGVTNGPSTAPSDPFTLELKSLEGYSMAISDGEVTLANTEPYELSQGAFQAQPEDGRLGAVTNYQISFLPHSFSVGMTLEIGLPKQITLANESSPLECSSLSKNVDTSITCVYDPSLEIVQVSKAFSTRLFDPALGLSFTIGPLTNPSSLITTDSFTIRSLTDEGYLIDARVSDLILTFDCLAPCQACAEGANDVCASCDVAGLSPILHDGTCLSQCPDGFVKVSESNTCEELVEVAPEPEPEPEQPIEDQEVDEEVDNQEEQTQEEPDSQQTDNSEEEENSGEQNKGQTEIVTQVDSSEGSHTFTFLIATFVWLLSAAILTRVAYKRAFYVPVAICGVQIISLVCSMSLALSLYPSRGLSSYAQSLLIASLGSPYSIQAVWLIVLICKVRHDRQFQAQLKRFKSSTLCFLALSVLVNYRLVKLLYLNLGSRSNLTSLREETSNGWSPRRLNMLFSFLMLMTDIAQAFVALSAYKLPTEDNQVKQASVELIVIVLALAALTLLEFIFPAASSRDQVEPNLITKGSSQLSSVAPNDEERNLYGGNQRMATNQLNNSSVMLTDVDVPAKSLDLHKQELMQQELQDSHSPIRHDRADQFLGETGQALERSTSADKGKERKKLSRFINRYSLVDMDMISERDSNQERSQEDLHVGGYMSDPTHLNEGELHKLLQAAPQLEDVLNKEPPTKGFIEWHESQRVASLDESKSLSDKEDGAGDMGFQTNYSSEHRNTLVAKPDMQAQVNDAQVNGAQVDDAQFNDASVNGAIVNDAQVNGAQFNVLYSDKSESSVEADMGLTPTDFRNQNLPKFRRYDTQQNLLKHGSDNDLEPEKLQATLSIDDSVQQIVGKNKVTMSTNRLDLLLDNDQSSNTQFARDRGLAATRTGTGVEKERQNSRTTSVPGLFSTGQGRHFHSTGQVGNAGMSKLLLKMPNRLTKGHKKGLSSRQTSQSSFKNRSDQRLGHSPSKSIYQQMPVLIKPPMAATAKSVRPRNLVSERAMDSESARRKSNSAFMGELILGKPTDLTSQVASTQRNGSSILYRASFKPHYYGMADFIETAEVKELDTPEGSSHVASHVASHKSLGLKDLTKRH